jgi:uncharacterized protein YebE (UPF0316 family)
MAVWIHKNCCPHLKRRRASLLENSYIMVAIILIINIVYVSFFTIRMILTLKGYRYIAAFVSMFEVVIYVVGLGLVLDNLNEIQNLVAYAVGYGLGVIAGMKIEEKLALGYITVNVITADYDKALPEKLRSKGYGVTNWAAHGLEGDRMAMQILTPRKNEIKLYQTIKELDPKAFIIAYEPKTIHGGFWVKTVRKIRKENLSANE